MQIIVNEAQRAHNPESFVVLGQVKPNPETPERLDRLLNAAVKAGHTVSAPSVTEGFAEIAAVHTPDYLTFLQTIHDEWRAVPGSGAQVMPNVHPTMPSDALITSPVGKAGMYQGDMACPIAAETWGSVLASAQSAIAAAYQVGEQETKPVYALCRPPGHHAFKDKAGGFCFVNNAAVAAQILRSVYARVCILDVDVHHGNGTQGIFYDRDDVLTVSLHRDPSNYYPFYWGHAHEIGEGAGRGFNMNYPLPKGAGDEAFLAALESAIQRIQAFAPQAMVVSLGLDAYEGDPLKGLKVTTEGFAAIAARISKMGLPTAIIQEGGYLCDALGDNLVSFLDGFENG